MCASMLSRLSLQSCHSSLPHFARVILVRSDIQPDVDGCVTCLHRAKGEVVKAVAQGLINAVVLDVVHYAKLWLSDADV